MPQVSHTARPARTAALGLALLALGSCGVTNTLEGSLGEVLDLSFVSVEVSITETAVIVGYNRPSGGEGEGRDIVLKLVAETPPVDIVGGKALDLTALPDGTPRATVTRSVADDPIRTLAAIKLGTLTFDGKVELDRPVTGSFRVTLGEGGDAGKGRTAFGTFTVKKVVQGN